MSFSFCFGGHITSVGEEALPEIREALRRSDAAILGSIPADRRTASCSALDRICSRGLARNGFNQTTEQAVVARGSQLRETAVAFILQEVPAVPMERLCLAHVIGRNSARLTATRRHCVRSTQRHKRRRFRPSP